jgi:hypothetical protein
VVLNGKKQPIIKGQRSNIFEPLLQFYGCGCNKQREIATAKRQKSHSLGTEAKFSAGQILVNGREEDLKFGKRW